MIIVQKKNKNGEYAWIFTNLKFSCSNNKYLFP